MNEFIQYLNNSIEAAQKKEQELIATERKDEANLQKIRANIYGICRKRTSRRCGDVHRMESGKR